MTRTLLARSLLWWLIGYLSISAVNSALTLGYGLVLASSRGATGFDLSYERTVVAQLVVGVALWTLASLGLWRGASWVETTARNSALVALVWLVISVLVDAVVFVGFLANTPAGAPADVFYVHNQPWTTLYYLAVVIGPPMALMWRRVQSRQRRPAHPSSC